MTDDAVANSPALDLLFGRRSTAALAAPGPTATQVDVLLRAATTVPDHGALRPYRFIVVEGDGRDVFGRALADAAVEHRPDLPEAGRDKAYGKAFMAPTQILLISSPNPAAKVEVWEQVATAACTGFAIVLAAHGLGLGAIWKSIAFTQGGPLADALELTPDEQLLGWVNLGTPTGVPGPRVVPSTAQLATLLRGDAVEVYPGS